MNLISNDSCFGAEVLYISKLYDCLTLDLQIQAPEMQSWVKDRGAINIKGMGVLKTYLLSHQVSY